MLLWQIWLIQTSQRVEQKAQKCIYSRNIQTLHAIFLKQNPHNKVSVSSFYRCKPFYISREMEGCLCVKC